MPKLEDFKVYEEDGDYSIHTGGPYTIMELYWIAQDIIHAYKLEDMSKVNLGGLGDGMLSLWWRLP